jgi:hypothetical protein
MRALVPHTKRERVANYGDTVTVSGQDRATAFDLQKDQGSFLTVVAQVESFSVPQAALGTADFRPFLHVEWGHGATMVKGDFDITWRQRIPLVASTVQVQVFIAAFPFPGQSNTPRVPPRAQLKARVFVSEGLDGTRLFPAQWQTQIGQASGILSANSARLSALRAFNPATAPDGQATSLVLLLFDKGTTPVAGDIPMDGMPVPFNTPEFGGLAQMALGQTRAFVNGISWGMSSTPFAFTPSATPISLSYELEQ